MTDPITFVVPGPPVPKARARRDPRTGHWYTPLRTRLWENDVAQWGMASGLRLGRRDMVKLRVEAYYSRGPWGDGSNVLKSVEDGLMRCCPEWDDRNVVEATITQAKVPNEPFTRVTVEVIGEN